MVTAVTCDLEWVPGQLRVSKQLTFGPDRIGATMERHGLIVSLFNGLLTSSSDCTWQSHMHPTGPGVELFLGVSDSYTSNNILIRFPASIHDMAAFQAAVDLAGQLGLSKGVSVSSNGDHISAALDVVFQHQRRCDASIDTIQQADYHDAAVIADSRRLKQRVNALEAGLDMAQSVVCNKDAVAESWRAAKTKSSIPVAPEHQPDFSALLDYSACSHPILQSGLSSMQWATALNQKPSVWEDELKPIVEEKKVLTSHLDALVHFAEVLQNSRHEPTSG